MEEDSTKGPVEMVTVPALGAEWGKDELKAMTKKGRKEEQSEGFGRKWRAFNRGQYGLFGSKWLTRRTIVFVVFALCAMYVFFPSNFFGAPRGPGLYLTPHLSLSQHQNCPCHRHPTRTRLCCQRDKPSYIRHRQHEWPLRCWPKIIDPTGPRVG